MDVLTILFSSPPHVRGSVESANVRTASPSLTVRLFILSVPVWHFLSLRFDMRTETGSRLGEPETTRRNRHHRGRNTARTPPRSPGPQRFRCCQGESMLYHATFEAGPKPTGSRLPLTFANVFLLTRNCLSVALTSRGIPPSRAALIGQAILICLTNLNDCTVALNISVSASAIPISDQSLNPLLLADVTPHRFAYSFLPKHKDQPPTADHDIPASQPRC